MMKRVKNFLIGLFVKIEERLVRDEIHATHTVRIDGQEMGVVVTVVIDVDC